MNLFCCLQQGSSCSLKPVSVTLHTYQIVLAEGNGQTFEKVTTCCHLLLPLSPKPHNSLSFNTQIVKRKHRRLYCGPDVTDTAVMVDRAHPGLRGEHILHHRCPVCAASYVSDFILQMSSLPVFLAIFLVYNTGCNQI